MERQAKSFAYPSLPWADKCPCPGALAFGPHFCRLLFPFCPSQLLRFSFPRSCSCWDENQEKEEWQDCCRKGDPFQGPKLGSCLTLRNELSEETHALTKQEILLGRAPGWRTGWWGNPGALLCCVARSPGFYGDGISFQVALANHSNSESFLVAHASLTRWMPARLILGSGRTGSVSSRPFRTLPAGGGLLVLYSLSGYPAIKQLMQMVTMVPGQGGWFQSVCFP